MLTFRTAVVTSLVLPSKEGSGALILDLHDGKVGAQPDPAAFRPFVQGQDTSGEVHFLKAG